MCERSVPCSNTAHFLGPGTVQGVVFRDSTVAHARAHEVNHVYYATLQQNDIIHALSVVLHCPVSALGNLLRPGRGQSNVSVGQRGTGDERQSCFGMVRSYLADCECALR